MRLSGPKPGSLKPHRDVRYIGVSLPTHLEISRQVLRGIRSFCNENKSFEPNLLSDRGKLGAAVAEAIPVIGLVAFSLEQGDIEDLRHRKLPVVLVTRRPTAIPVPRVVDDEYAIGRLGAQHLLSRGHRTLVFIGRVEHKGFLAQERGFQSRLAEEGINASILNPELTFAGFRSAIDSIRDMPHPVGVMAANDVLARLLVSSLENPMAEVPTRMAVLGVDDDDMENTLSPVPLSSVRPAGERIGYEAASLVVRLAQGAPEPKEPLVIPPVGVVARLSTDTFAVRDPVVARTLRAIHEQPADFTDAWAIIRRSGLSRRTLEKRFNRATGRTLAAELNTARIEKASLLMVTTDLPIARISELVGFSEPRMLTIVFKRVTGELPSEYRARVRPGE
ncbi:MAG: substrate-binding domain-containing protein [Oceanipulchritudo sp.]